MSEPIWRFRRENEIAPEGSMLTNMGWLVPVEPDYEAMANLMVQKIDVAAWWTDSNREKLARELWRAGIGGDDA